MAMKNRKRGRIFLEAASGEEVRQKLLFYLCRKTPGVLIDNVPFPKAKTMLADLERLGAVARFLPDPKPLSR